MSTEFLAEPTRESWLPEALGALDVVLLDHAHCEKKAASMAINLIFRYQRHAALMAPLSRLAREELLHFEQTMQHLRRRNVPFGPLDPSPYAGRLMKHVRPERREKMLDTLLCCALIEARSHERMVLLADAVDDPALARFYRGLLASEARHLSLYADMAAAQFSADEASARLEELAAAEAAVLRQPSPAPRMHS